MLIENTIRPAQPVYLRNSTTDLNRHGETFHDMLRRSLSSKSNSRPPKTEVTGILVPIKEAKLGRLYKYKLETDSKDFLLHMNKAQNQVAEKIEWEEVTVKGYLDDFESNVIEVERISIAPPNEPYRFTLASSEFRPEPDDYVKAIAQRGKLEPDFLAS